jgi:hypothetical protein
MNSPFNTFADILSLLGEGTIEDQNPSLPQGSDNLLAQPEDYLDCSNTKLEIPDLWDAGFLDPLGGQYSAHVYSQVRFERTGA